MHEHRHNHLVAFLAAIALLLASCGGGDDAPTAEDDPAGGGSPRTTTTRVPSTTERGGTTTTASTTSSPDLICEDPPPTEVGLGTPLDSDLDSQQCFWVDVPEGLSSVTVAISGLDTEVRLGVYYGYIWNVQFPGGAAFWTADRQTGQTEVTIGDPQPGPYFFYLSKARNAVSDFTVEVTTEPATTAGPTGGSIAGKDACAGPATVLSSGDVVEGRILDRSSEGGDEHHVYYCVEADDGDETLTIELTEAEGYFDIQVSPPDEDGLTLYQVEMLIPEKTLTIEDVSPGAYYIDIGPALASAAGTFNITVTVS